VLVKFSENFEQESAYKFFVHHKTDIKYGKERRKKMPLEFLHEMMNRFIGFEIVDHGKDYVLIKEMSEPTSKEFDNSLRRVFLLIQQMAEETCEAIEKNNPKIVSHFHDVDINVDKFVDYCIRILNKLENKESRKNSLLFSTLYILELMGDEYKNISHHLIYDYEKTNFKNIVDMANGTKEHFNLVYDMFYKFEKEKVAESSNLDRERYFITPKMYKSAKSEEEKEIFHHLRIITRYFNALVELFVEMRF
jgi:phosphate uptake regulator